MSEERICRDVEAPGGYQSEAMVERIKRDFTYHAPKPERGQVERYAMIRDETRALAHGIACWCPESRERSLALTKLEEAVFWANAAIVRNE